MHQNHPAFYIYSNNMDQKELFLLRTIDLALQADLRIRSNPPVGCVLVRDSRIIGEGWHKIYGQAHAEVNAVRDAIQSGHQPDEQTEVYVSLEPCGHFGKTPPCASLIAQFHPSMVTIFERDAHPVTTGKGLEILATNGVKWQMGHPENEPSLLDRFYANNIEKRPWIILKYAQTADQKMASSIRRIRISDQYTARLTHKWRSQCDGILIGSGTLNTDDARLTNRFWTGPSPHRFVIGKHFDKNIREFSMFTDGGRSTWINTGSDTSEGVDTLEFRSYQWQDLWHILYEKYNITCLMIEGGPAVLQSIADQGSFDEVRVITSSSKIEDADIASPVIAALKEVKKLKLVNDTVSWYRKDQ